MAKGYGKRAGDRREGRRLRGLAAAFTVSPYIMRRRSDACSSFADTLEITAIEQWILQKRAEGSSNLNLTHLMCAAYVRAVSMVPAVNRFVSGYRIFARDDIQLVLRVRRSVSGESSWTSVKVSCSPTDTVYDVYSRISKAVDSIQADTGESPYDMLVSRLGGLPRGALRFVFWTLRWLDHYDLLPRRWLEASPFHGSMAVCDTGSLGIQPVTHHIGDFGNLPVYLSFGAKQRRYEYSSEGELLERHYVDYRFTVDERIADVGVYTEALKCMKYFLRYPELLEHAPDSVETDRN